MSEQTKQLTSEEMSTLKALRETYSEVTAKLGRLSIQQMLMVTDLNAINTEMDTLKELYRTTNKKEEEFLSKIHSTYGEGSINTETGEFTINQ